MIKKIYLKVWQRLSSNDWIKQSISTYFIDSSNIQLSLPKGVFFTLFNFFVPKNNFKFFIDGYKFAKNLKTFANASFLFNEEQIIITINNVIHIVETYEELFILNEIYVEKCYNYHIPNKENITFIDIGTNVGFSCLFFAQSTNVKAIFGFEPLRETYLQSQKNLSLNPSISSKITIYNYGLGNRNYSSAVKFDSSKKGQAGLLNYPLVKDKSTLNSSIISIRNAKDELNKIIDKNKGYTFIIKMDCEGGEFDIFEVLDSITLECIQLILMEWHWKKPTPILEKLHLSNYTTITTQIDENSGLIYAFKK